MPSAVSSPTDLPSKEEVNRCGAKLAEWWGLEVELSREEVGENLRPVHIWRAEHAYPMSLLMPTLRNWADRYSTSHIKPSQRLKRIPQILGKLNRHPGMKLARMQDIGGARAVFGNRDEVELVHDRIKRYWKVDRTKDWREFGRPDTGYRALHVMIAKRDRISNEDRIVEVQLRTASEQRWSDVIMATGDRLGYSLKDGQGPDELLAYFRVASNVLALIDRGETADEELREHFAELREQVRPYFAMKETD
jgi:putative GTP pyrophosphokinase